MQFLDEAKIYLQSGAGGNGCVSFRRERNIPKGGPNGGDGGRGGSIIFTTDADLNTLIDFRFKQHFKAKHGQHGMGSNMHGSKAEDIIIPVPVGTQVLAEDQETLLLDLDKPGMRVTLLPGGEGGLGNVHFKSSTNRAPRQATSGEPGQEQWVWLQLKLLSDAGLLGLPNAGKSTFLAATSRAKPKIADYPFTTLVPQLGVVTTGDKSFVLADIPGLIAGAAQGTGLGHQFLRHVERCGVLLHLVDGTSDSIAEDYRTIIGELAAYDHGLADKPRLLALNKCDALDAETRRQKQQELAAVSGLEVACISAATGEGIPPLLHAMHQAMVAHRQEQAEKAGQSEEGEHAAEA